MNGLIVGFTSSLPLLLIVGPMALMIVDTGLTSGVRAGWPAPVGVATVDLAYASLTAAAGVGLQRALGEHRQAMGWLGGAALLGLAAYLLMQAQGQRRQPATHPARPTHVAHTAPIGLAARFAALCAINPLTLMAFGSLAVSAGANLGPGWVVGIVAASLLVHGSYLVLGGAMGRVLTPALVHRGRLLGSVGVAALGVHTLVGVAA
ncbi:MAG: LysE family transporter [Microthrixaceae bacterium]